jgi:RNA-directed DNA polymerase
MWACYWMVKSMPKTIRNEYYNKLNFINLINAHNRAVVGKRNKMEVLLFEMDLETNISYILNKLNNQTYSLGNYREFKIYEPKERIIKSLPYRDRVVHQWYVYEFIKPYIIPRFIKDTYACIDNRGTLLATKMTQRYMNHMKVKYNNYYVIKGDIKKYFYSINKNILFSIMKKYIKDKKLLWLTKVLIYDDSNLKGIPIGNYTSQYFANIYLNELDHYVKDNLNIKYYLRYMDDFVILLPTKEKCKEVLNWINSYIKTTLDLELNHKTRYYPNKFGVNFCGYIIHEKYMLLRKTCIKKIKTSLKRDDFNIKNYKGYIKYANCFNFLKSIKKNI